MHKKQKRIGLVLVLALISVSVGCVSTEKNLTINEGSYMRLVTIWKYESPAINFSPGGTEEMSFLIIAERDDIPFICHFNGGATEPGGWDVKVPAQKDWKKLKFDMTATRHYGLCVTLEVAPESKVGRADLIYSVSPISKK
ncbi:MAG: hypothetical protein V4697_01495 [Patescibacteria group bacterium]